MFKFDFLNDEKKKVDSDAESADHIWYVAKEIFPRSELIEDIIRLNTIKTFHCGNLNIKHVNVDTKIMLPENVESNSIAKAESDHSDLLTAVYEGGLKIWECTIDLANYIKERNFDFRDKMVLDLGCGAGVIGILCLLDGAKVYFQDYNEEVIQYLTIPNVHLNSGISKINKCQFFCGDWDSFLELIKGNKFDYIFTSETIYNCSSYSKLYAIFKECLKSNGVIYVAAKTHYFGVGGGIRHFEEYLKEEPLFDVSTCWKCSDGLQRAILNVILK